MVTRDKETILAADKVILPGVGAFGDAMDKLCQYDLPDVIRKVTEKGTPFLGICLGQQLLFDSSEECEESKDFLFYQEKLYVFRTSPGLRFPYGLEQPDNQAGRKTF